MVSVVTINSCNTDRNFFVCPNCGTKDIFFIVSSSKCSKCNKKLPNYSELITTVKARLQYFKNEND